MLKDLSNFELQTTNFEPKMSRRRLPQFEVRSLKFEVSVTGWGGRIRTFEYGIQSPAPYRLATPQNIHPLSRVILRGSKSPCKPKSLAQAQAPNRLEAREGPHRHHQPTGRRQE